MIIILLPNIFSNNVHDRQGKGMTMIIHTHIYNDIHRINRHTLMSNLLSKRTTHEPHIIYCTCIEVQAQRSIINTLHYTLYTNVHPNTKCI